MSNVTANDLAKDSVASVHISHEKRSVYRWLVLLMLAMMALITFMDRTNISIAAPMIMKEFGFGKAQMGFVFGAFAWAYALGQIPGGWLSDKFGPRTVLTLVVLFWSLMTMVTAHAWGFISMLVIRFIFGLGEAAAWPACTQAMQFWYPKSERGVTNGVTHSCGQFATSAVPLVAVAIMTAWGWRSIFHIFGVVGIVWSIAWWFMYRDRPEQSKRVNAAEATYIRDGRVATEAKKKIKIPWALILGCPTTWVIGVVFSAQIYSMAFFWYWMPTYLMEFRHISLKNMGHLAPLPLFAGSVGVMVGGVLSDYLLRKTGSLKWSRCSIGIVSLAGAAIAIIPAAFFAKPVPVMICLIVCNFLVQLNNAPCWAVCLDIGGGYAGMVSSVMNMLAQLAAALSAILFGMFVQKGFWIAPFFVMAVILFGGALLWAFAINPERTVVERA